MGAVHFEADLDTDKLHQRIDKVERDISNMGETVAREGQQMDAAFRKAAAAIGTLFTLAAGKQFVSQLVSVRGEFQQLNISLETILGNKEKADQLFQDVVDFAAYTPFELTEVGQGVKKLLAFNVEAEDTLDILRRLGDIAAGLSTDLDGLVQAYGKVKAKGKLQAEEMNLFLERGIPLVSELAEMYGVAESAIYEMASKGQVSFEDLHQVLVNLTDDGGKFADLMQKQVESLPGQISNLKDAISQMLNDIGQANEGILYGSIGVAKDLVENYETVIAVLKTLIATYGAYKAAVIVNTLLEQAEAAGSLAKALKSTAVAQRALNLAQKASPIGLVVAGITGLITAYLTLKKRTKEAADEALRFKDAYEGIDEAVRTNYADQLLELDQLKQRLEEVKGSREKEQELIKTINERYSTHLENLVSEKAAYEDLKVAIDQVVKSMERQMEIDIRLEKARVQKKKILETEDILDSVVGDYAGQALTPKIQRELDRRAQEVLKERYGGKVVTGVGSPFEILKKKLQEDYNAYEKELNRLMDQVKDLEAEILGEAGNVEPEDEKAESTLAKQIREAEKAYRTLADLRKAGLEEDTEDFFEKYLEDGANYEEWLRTLRQKYEGHAEELVVINAALAKEVISQMEQIEEARLEMFRWRQGELKKIIEKIGDSMRDYFQQLESDLVQDASSEDFDPAEKIVKTMFGRTYTSSQLQNFYDDVNEFGSALTNLGSNVSRFDELAGQSINIVGQLTSSISAFSSGNITSIMSSVTAVASAIAEFVMILEAQRDQIQAEHLARNAERIERSVAAINRHLDQQYYLLSKLDGSDWLRQAYDTVEDIDKAIEGIVNAIKTTDLRFKALIDPEGDPSDPANHQKVVISPEWDEQDLRNFLRQYGDALTLESQQEIQNYLDQIDQLRRDAEDLIEDIKIERIGFGVDYLTDSIMEMFAQMEDGAISFGDTFDDVMREVAMNFIKNNIVMKEVQKFYDELDEALRTGTRGVDENGNVINSRLSPISDQEKEYLEGLWGDIMGDIQSQYEYVTDFFEKMGVDLFPSGDDPNSLAGAIRRSITEETGSLLAGRMNTIMLDVRENTLNTAALVNHSAAIEQNTALTAQRLAVVGSDIRKIRQSLAGGGGR